MPLSRRLLLSAPLWSAVFPTLGSVPGSALGSTQAATPAAAPGSTPPGSPPAAPAPDLLDRLRALGLRAAHAGRLTLWFTAALQARAESLAAPIDDAAAYFDDRLGIAGQLHLAVLTREHWGALIPGQPYGITGVAGRPPVLFMPAGDDGLTAEDTLALQARVAPATLQALTAAGNGDATAARRYVDLTGLHALGQASARRYGIQANSRWFDAWVASYFAYAYLRERRPALAALWDGVLQARVDAVRPAHTSLADFDQLGFDVGAQNYVWYQAQFQRRARQVFGARGIDFLVDLRMRFGTPSPVALTPERLLPRLEAVLPGFKAWADSLAR